MRDNASTPVLAFHDIRWNSWRWRPILERWGHIRVLINPDIIKTVGFLIDEQGNVCSTVFFVRVPLGEPGQQVFGYSYYAVTTWHSVQERVAIRFNKETGGIHDVVTCDWVTNRATEVAILPLDFSLDDYELEWIELEHFADSTDYVVHRELEPMSSKGEGHVHLTISSDPYGLGDEVFSVGLFGGHSGTVRAQPAVRFGHIALKPSEKVLAQIEGAPAPYELIEGFLIEMSTWEGQSGSPVFFRPRISDDRDFKRPKWEISYLIGMIQGMYPGHEWVKAYTKQSDELEVFAPFNMGIGITVPSKAIVGVLMNNADLKKARENKLKERKTTPKVRPAVASIQREKPFTQTAFENALKKASSKVFEPESEKKRKPA
jgi:hypothetical protein